MPPATSLTNPFSFHCLRNLGFLFNFPRFTQTTTVHGHMLQRKIQGLFRALVTDPDLTNYHPPRTTFHAQIRQEKQKQLRRCRKCFATLILGHQGDEYL